MVHLLRLWHTLGLHCRPLLLTTAVQVRKGRRMLGLQMAALDRMWIATRRKPELGASDPESTLQNLPRQLTLGFLRLLVGHCPKAFRELPLRLRGLLDQVVKGCCLQLILLRELSLRELRLKIPLVGFAKPAQALRRQVRDPHWASWAHRARRPFSRWSKLKSSTCSIA